MKSEHRHELAENDLSKLLGRWGAEFDKHANTILSVLIVVALIAAAIIYWTRTSAATSAAGWTDLTRAGTAEDFQNVAEDYAGTQVAQWATLRAGDAYLREGIQLSLTDRTVSDERLAEAHKSYESLLQNQGAPRVVREQALLGYAVTLESTSDGDTNAAVAAYEKLLEEFADSRFKGYAADRIAELKTGGAQDFYAWFHQLNPKPAERPGPQDQLKLPDGSDLSNLLPELGGSGIPLATDTDDATNANPFAAEEMKDEQPPAEGEAPKPEDAPSDDSRDEQKPDEKPEGTQSEDKQPSGEQSSDAGKEEPAPADKDASSDDPAETDKPADEADAPSE